MADRSALTSARATLLTQRMALVDALFADSQSDQAVLAAARQSASALAAAQATKATTAATVTQTRSAVDSAESALTAAISAWLGSTDKDSDIARLEAASPIVLFPVRIETRFEATTLKLRVYPDEIFFNSHETALTPAEFAAGQKYYTDLNTGTGPSQMDDWRQMVIDFGAERAAYILRIMLPIFGGETSLATSSCLIPTGQSEELTFPTDVQLRPSTWTRATEAILPDRWVVMTRRGNARSFFLGSPIPEPLPVTVDPSASTDRQSQLANGFTVDDRSRWTVDFDRAVQVGMALQIPLSTQDAQLGFDRVVVFGVKTSMDALTTSAMLEELLDAHHYTRGIALLRQGSATNNTKDHPTEFPPKDDAGTFSFAIERNPPPCDRFHAHPVLPTTSDGYFWTKLMGVPSGVLQNVDRAYDSEHERATFMNTVLWPVTYGSFLQFMMSPIFSAQAIANAKAYFIANVFPRGPAPAFRIGAVPYGILPVASLTRWQSRGLGSATDEAVETALLGPLQLAVPIWKNASSNVNRITASSQNPQIDLIKALSLYPSAREMRLRFGFGEFLTFNLFNLLTWDVAEAFATFDQKTSDLFARIGHPEWRPRIGRTTFLRPQYLETTPFVDLAKNLSETSPLSSDYLTGLGNAVGTDLVNNTVSGKPQQDSLLYELLRTSTLTEYARVADAFLLGQPFYVFPWLNYEVWGLAGLPPPSSSIIALLEQPSSVPPANQYPTLGHFARAQSTDHFGALEALAPASTAELDRLFTETLDVASHRIDAWVTAFATRRIFALRSAQEQTSMAPLGTFLGGYGWVEDLRPSPRTTTTAPDGTLVEVDTTTGGFVHSPSSTHAMAAAVLRNAFLSFSKEDPQKCAFDLSSRRVRGALQVLEEVRNGQLLGEVLGYRFERGLQEGHPGVPNLNALRFTFRGLFPLVAGKNGVDTAAPANLAAARTVVDGLALYRAFKAGTIDFTGNPALPSPGTSAYAAVIAELGALDQLLDGVGDLVTAEGVYQLVSGNVSGASPSLDNLARGGRPPTPSIAQSPRAGRGLTHRVVYTFQGSPPAVSSHWPAPTSSARATAEPVLDAWLGNLIGDPNNVTATVTFKNGAGQAASATVTLTKLGIRPLDLLALARAVAQPNQAGLLDARIVVAAIGDDTTNTDVVVVHDPAPGRDPATNRTFPEVVELLATLAATLGGARPLAVADLLTPADQTTQLPAVEATALTNANDFVARGNAAVNQLSAQGDTIQAALGGLNPGDPTTVQTLRDAVRGAAQFAPERALVPSGVAASTLSDTATALLTEIAKRLKAAQAAQQTLTVSPPPASPAVLQAGFSILQAVFGADFFAMPNVSPPNESELTQAFAANSTLVGGDQRAIARFLQQASHGRTQLEKYRKFSLYARALGAAAPSTEIAQIPFTPGETWLALPFTTPPDESRLSLVFVSQASSLDPSLDWNGIVLDSWTEIIPSTQQPTSIALNYNSPRPNAPQSVLVVAPSNNGANWGAADVVASLEETLDLAKARAVDRELLDIGQMLPAVVIPNSLNTQVTVSSGNIGVTVTLGNFFSVGFS